MKTVISDTYINIDIAYEVIVFITFSLMLTTGI